jgi:hypothetical protein
VLLKS